MEIRRWSVIDIHFRENEEKEVEKKIRQLERSGYASKQFDQSGSKNHNACVQLIKILRVKTK